MRSDGAKAKLQYSTSQLLNYTRDSYLERTSRPLYGIVFLLPFIAFYEVGTMLINTDILNQYQVRVVAFVWLQDALGFLGYNGKLAWMAPPLVVILILFGLQLASRKPWYFNFRDCLPMLVECTLLAIPLIVLSLFINSRAPGHADVNQMAAVAGPAQVLPINGTILQGGPEISYSPLLASIITGIGAGIYEELVFRLILISVLMMIIQDALGVNHKSALILSVLISAALFSAHHHIFFIAGEFTRRSAFNWSAFTFRTLAGIYFAMLFAARGFGMTAGTHAFYDIIATLLNAFFFRGI